MPSIEGSCLNTKNEISSEGLVIKGNPKNSTNDTRIVINKAKAKHFDNRMVRVYNISLNEYNSVFLQGGKR